VEIRRAGCNGVLTLQAGHRKTGVRHVWYSTTELGGRMNRRMSQGRLDGPVMIEYVSFKEDSGVSSATTSLLIIIAVASNLLKFGSCRSASGVAPGPGIIVVGI